MTALNIARYLPKNFKLSHLGKKYKFNQIIHGIDGGYAVTEYLHLIGTCDDLYFNIAIADSQFELKSVYEQLCKQSIDELSETELEFVINIKFNKIQHPSPYNNEQT